MLDTRNGRKRGEKNQCEPKCENEREQTECQPDWLRFPAVSFNRTGRQYRLRSTLVFAARVSFSRVTHGDSNVRGKWRGHGKEIPPGGGNCCGACEGGRIPGTGGEKEKEKERERVGRSRSIESRRVTGYTEHRCERHHERRFREIQHNLSRDHRTYTLAFDIGGGGGGGDGGGSGVCVPVGKVRWRRTEMR